MSDEQAEVTFVGGKAIEQTEALESALPVDEREAAIKAVREAMKGEQPKAEKSKKETIKEAAEEVGTEDDPDDIEAKVKDPGGVNRFRKSEKAKESEESPDRGPDGKFLPKDGPKKPQEASEDEELDISKASVKQLLKAREKVANLKKTAAEMTKEQAKFQEESQKIQQVWAQIQQREASLKEQEARWSRLQQDPSAAVRALGIEPEQFIMNLAKEGTPEGALDRKLRQMEEAIKEANSWKEQQAQERQRYQQQLQEQQVVQYRQQAVQDFTKLGMDGDKYPHISAFYKGRERALVAEGDLTAEEFRNLSGREGSYEQILDFIEDELADRANAWYSSKSTAKKATAVDSVSKGSPPKAKGKSLSPDMSSERRSASPKDLKDLSPEDRIEAARQAVAAAMAGARR